jgi:hypothetical protein
MTAHTSLLIDPAQKPTVIDSIEGLRKVRGPTLTHKIFTLKYCDDVVIEEKIGMKEGERLKVALR